MTTSLEQVQGNIQKYWSPIFTDELRAKLLLGSLVSKKYDGEIKKGGDQVTVTQIVAANGQLLTVGVNADSFESEGIQTAQVAIKADKRAVASYEFSDLVALQSQIDGESSEARASLTYALNKQINDYLYSLVAPSSSSPAHVITGVSAMDKATFVSVRKKAGAAKWLKNGWYALLDPDYHGDVLGDSVLGSRDFGGDDAPIIGGELGMKRLGFNVYEDDSRASKKGLFFHPDFLHMVSQTQVQIKISDLHPLGRFGYKMSVDLIFGAALGIDGAKKHITVGA